MDISILIQTLLYTYVGIKPVCVYYFIKMYKYVYRFKKSVQTYKMCQDKLHVIEKMYVYMCNL